MATVAIQFLVVLVIAYCSVRELARALAERKIIEMFFVSRTPARGHILDQQHRGN